MPNPTSAAPQISLAVLCITQLTMLQLGGDIYTSVYRPPHIKPPSIPMGATGA